MATIVQREGRGGRRVWQAQIRKKGYPRQTKTFDRKADAIKWARMIERQMDENTWRNLKGAESLRLDEALDRYLGEVSTKKRPRTADRDRLSVSHLKSGLGSYTLPLVTPDKVARYRDKRLKLVSANSVRIELALLSHFFNVARKEWGIGVFENPVQVIDKPRIPEGRCPVVSEMQISRLLEECRKSRSKLLHPFVLLALHTGCRSLELRGLRWSQVDLDVGSISLLGSEVKAHASRIVPLTSAAIDILRGLLEEARRKRKVDQNGIPVGLIFPARGHPDKPRDLHKAFDLAVGKAGLKNLPGLGKLRIHDLRHLCGTYLIMEGADLETVRDILGHKDYSTTRRYLHLVNEHKRKAISRIGHLGMNHKEENRRADDGKE